MSAKTRNIIGWVLTVVISALIIMSAYMKIMSSPETIKGAAKIGLSAAVYRAIGFMELLIIALFIIPRTGLLGTLLLAAYLGGAIATLLEHGMTPTVPVIVQCIVWITATIRFPELSKRLTGSLNGI